MVARGDCPSLEREGDAGVLGVPVPLGVSDVDSKVDRLMRGV